MMKKYEDATWNDLATYGEVSPVAGLDAVTSKQLSELLGVPMEAVSKHKSRYDKELRSLGMFTAAPKKLADRLHVLERTPGNGFAVELEGGGRLELYCGNTVYFTAPAACRLADVISGVNDEKKNGPRCGCAPSTGTNPAQLALARAFSAQDTGLQVFSSPEFGSIRALEIDGEPWFVGKDVAAALGYKDTDDAIRAHVDKEDKLTRQFTGSGQKRDMYVVNESGVYDLVFGSSLPGAKRFRHWVTNEVLPSIRKHGGYLLGQETMDPEELMERAVLYAQSRIKEKDECIRALDIENKALAREQLTWDYRSILVRLVRMYGAKVFDDFKKGWRAFFRELRYKEGICLNNRAGDGPFIDRLVGDEWVKAVAVAASMCKEQYISMSWAVNEVNLDLVNGC